MTDSGLVKTSCSVVVPRRNLSTLPNGHRRGSISIVSDLRTLLVFVQELARLFWAAQHLGPDDDYALTRAVLDREDLFKQVFDRELCLHDPAARACVAHDDNGEEAEWRHGIKSLNLVLSSTSVEDLDEAEILELLNSFDSMDEQ